MDTNSADLLTVKEVASILRCSEVSIWRRRKEGKIRGSKIGGKILINRKDLQDLVESSMEETSHGK